MIPQAVAGELEVRPGAPGSGVPSLEWVERRSPSADGVGRAANVLGVSVHRVHELAGVQRVEIGGTAEDYRRSIETAHGLL